MSDKVALSDIIIELHVPDFEKVKDFYEKLGFEKVWENPPKEQSGYLVMEKGNSILAFFCGNEEVYRHPYFKKFPKDTPRGYGVEVCLYLSEQEPIDKYYEIVKTNLGEACIVEELQMKPWGRKDFRIIDPFGYYICVREPDNILNA